MITRKLCLILIVGICLLHVPAARAQDANGKDGDLSAPPMAGKSSWACGMTTISRPG